MATYFGSYFGAWFGYGAAPSQQGSYFGAAYFGTSYFAGEPDPVDEVTPAPTAAPAPAAPSRGGRFPARRSDFTFGPEASFELDPAVLRRRRIRQEDDLVLALIQKFVEEMT